MKQFNELKEECNLIGEVRGKGLLIGVELVKDRKSRKPAAEETVRVRDLCREKGVLVGHGGVKGNVVRIQPPLVINKQEMDVVLQTIEESLKKI